MKTNPHKWMKSGVDANQSVVDIHCIDDAVSSLFLLGETYIRRRRRRYFHILSKKMKYIRKGIEKSSNEEAKPSGSVPTHICSGTFAIIDDVDDVWPFRLCFC